MPANSSPPANSSSPRVILSALGSRGDVNPFLAIARRLQQLGARPLVLVAEPYLNLPRQMGIEARAVIPADEFHTMLNHPDLWRNFHGPRMLIRDVIVSYLPRVLEVLEQEIEGPDTILVAHPLDLASRVIRDERPELRLCSVHLAPATIRSRTDPQRLGRGLFGIRRPSALFHALLYAADRLLIDRWLTPDLNAIRRERGLPAVDRPLQHWCYSPDAVLCLFPEWYGASDMPSHFHCVGFPRYDGPEQERPGSPPTEDAAAACSQHADKLSRFQDTPHPRIVFVPGSAHLRAASFFEAATEACGRMPCSGMLLSADPGQLPRNLLPNVHTAKYLPLSQLLPHCDAIVHHGGIGTTSQAFAAGIPQLICPMAFDQFDNSMRAARVGVAEELPMQRVTAARLVRGMNRLCKDERYRQRAGQLAESFEPAEAVAQRAAQWVLGQHDQR